MQIRNATVHDVESIFEVRCGVTENHLSREELTELGVTPESVRNMIQGEEYVVPVALLGGKIAGFAMGQISEGYLFPLFVRPEFENKGIGRTLLEYVENEFRRNNIQENWLATGAEEHLRAIGFYKHLGWTVSGSLPDGQIRMCKKLCDG